MKITPFFHWYDMYIGPYIDLENKAVYLVFLGLGLKISWGETVHANQKEIYSPDGTELWAEVDSRPTLKRQENCIYDIVAERVDIRYKHAGVVAHLEFYKGVPPRNYHLYTGKVSADPFSPFAYEGRSLFFEMHNAEENLVLGLGKEYGAFFLSQDIHDDLARSGSKEAQLIIRVLE